MSKIIGGKYEILKELGRGGMSIVYLAMDRRLNKQWAVKEIKKRGNRIGDEIVISSLLAEADLMKRLDHPSFPRIVDILDREDFVYVVMDYIEGKSMDKLLAEGEKFSEEQVIEWGRQICSALLYLHSQEPQIIYRDLKPANIMLRPEGNIKIIDFGAAVQRVEEENLDTKPLGTRGYAPPEQYSGRMDIRSDIYSLGMTLFTLLTGCDVRKEPGYRPVKEIDESISEGVEMIIDRCVQEKPDDRYQNCEELMRDLEHPELKTLAFKRRQKMRFAAFVITAGMSIILAAAGFVTRAAAENINKNDYLVNISSNTPDAYMHAAEIYPGRIEAYEMLVEYYQDKESTNAELLKAGNFILGNILNMNLEDEGFSRVFYSMGRLIFSEYQGSLKEKSINAKMFFRYACEGQSFEKIMMAECYLNICDLVTGQSTSREAGLQDYERVIENIKACMNSAEAEEDGEANYDRIILYYTAMIFINDRAEFMAGAGFGQEDATNLMEELYNGAMGISSTLKIVNELKEKIQNNYENQMMNIQAVYSEREKNE